MPDRTTLAATVVRCRSWRPVPATESGHENHAPGSCRVCWRPCKQRFTEDVPGIVRCPECEVALSRHLNSEVRIQLVREVPLRISTWELFTSDSVGQIQAAAEAALGHLEADRAVFPEDPYDDDDEVSSWDRWADTNPVTDTHQVTDTHPEDIYEDDLDTDGADDESATHEGGWW